MWRFIPICPRKKSGESTNWPHIFKGGKKRHFFPFSFFTRSLDKSDARLWEKSWKGEGGKIVSNFLKSHFPSTCKRNGEEREREHPFFRRYLLLSFLSPIFDSELNRKETYGGNSLFPGSFHAVFLVATHKHFPLMEKEQDIRNSFLLTLSWLRLCILFCSTVVRVIIFLFRHRGRETKTAPPAKASLSCQTTTPPSLPLIFVKGEEGRERGKEYRKNSALTLPPCLP